MREVGRKGGSSGNIFCFEKMEFKGMKNEFGEINVGVGRRGGHNYCPEATRKDLGGCVSVGYDQNFPSGLEYLKCQSSPTSLDVSP